MGWELINARRSISDAHHAMINRAHTTDQHLLDYKESLNREVRKIYRILTENPRDGGDIVDICHLGSDRYVAFTEFDGWAVVYDVDDLKHQVRLRGLSSTWQHDPP